MKKILLAYDGSAQARRALDEAIELMAALDASLTIISVVPEQFGLSASIDPFNDDRLHGDQLEEALASLERRGLKADTLRPRGDPARVIERVARNDGYDVVVMGSRGRGTRSRILLGSVSAHVAARVRCTVVIVH